jgi:hypothetical protein
MAYPSAKESHLAANHAGLDQGWCVGSSEPISSQGEHDELHGKGKKQALTSIDLLGKEMSIMRSMYVPYCGVYL